ncbi:MAG: ATP-dependent zinc metalloprotease FtsH [Parachlamydiaceae bacterium]
MANDKKNEFKRNIPGGFVWFLMAAFFMALMLQNYIETKFAKVSFSYQLEHLVNLQLLQPEDSKKTALNDNLVTFSGQFREKQTEEGKNRFKYLELLNTNHQLHQEQTRIDGELTENRAKILSAGDYFLHLSGIPVPKDGYVIVDALYNTPPKDNSVVIRELSKRSIQSLPDVKAEYANLKETPSEAFFKKFGKSLNDLIRNFRSLELGIGNEAIKEKLKALDADVVNLNQAGNLKNLTPYETVLGELQFIVNDLNEVEDHIRLLKLRSVRSYKKALDENSDIVQKLDENDTQLDKARQAVSGVVWFFNNQELSTRSLEKQDPDQFAQWFNNAKEEWTRFQQNAGGFFKAPDQPLNTALEKTFKSEEPAPNYLSYLFTIMPVLLVLGVLYLVFSRQMKGMGSNAMSFGKSPARLVLPEGPNKVTFKDVAGADEAIEELQEIVEFLKNPQHFTTLGGRIPKGVLCIGPPGTGKTLLAKAVAGEADRPFFSISGSDFVEMFVGVGASRIRDLFDQAKKNAPCIVFIDEIDAVGRHRGAGIGGGHDEREQTLNQLLVEMDGFDTNEGVILMAATNRPDVLDKALLRPGRFDRRVVVSLPDVKGRYDILKVHARKIKMDASVDLMSIARSTPGSSGADLANILNEAALLAARRGRSAVTAQEAQEARDKVLYGKERRSLEMDENEKLTTAYHETGHTIVGLVVKHSDPVDKVSIIPRGMSLGSTMFLPKKNRLSYWRNEILDQLAVLMGGRCAEELFVHDISSGAQQDIERATQLARSMVCEWGMSDKLGAVAYTDRGEAQQMGFGGKEKAYSEETARAIDQEVKQLLDEAHKKAKEILEQHRQEVELMTQMLMEFETLDSEDIDLIMKGTWSVEEKKRKLKMQEELHKKQMSPPPPPPPVVEKETSINNLPRPSQEPTS